jgi:2-haloacid dehalogenase
MRMSGGARPPGGLPIQALTFDTYGTVVDWRSSVLDALLRFGTARGLSVAWPTLLDDWKAGYRPGLDRVNRGEWPWTTVETIYRRRLDELLPRYGLAALSEGDRQELTRAWWRLAPWPDAVPALRRLRQRFIVSPLSNASFRGMVELARFAGLPWHCILTAELARCYKPRPEVYRMAVALLGLRPDEVLMVAAHNYDLRAARDAGLRTAFVPRPAEHGPGQTTDLEPQEAWDVVAADFLDLAEQLGT